MYKMIPHLNVAGNCTKEIDVIELFTRFRTLPGNIKSGHLSGQLKAGVLKYGVPHLGLPQVAKSDA
jgi:hypothetical protein